MSALTRTPRPRRLIASALLLAAVAATAATGAPAAVAAPVVPAAPSAAVAAGTATAATPKPGPGTITWSATPSSASGPDHRSKFVYYDIKPGSVIHDRVAVINRSGTSVSFTIYGTEATGITAQNVFTWLRVGLKPKDIGAWEKFQLAKQVSPQLSVIIGGHQGIVVPFSISVPTFATPGDHTGAVMAQVGIPRKSGEHTSIIVYNRIAVPIELRVKGPYHAGLQVQSVSTSFNNSINPFGTGAAVVSYTIANTGNLRLTGKDLVKVTGPFGIKATPKAPTLPSILPGTSVRITAVAGGLYPAGPLGAHVAVTPAWPRDESPVNLQLAAAQSSGSLFAVPWSLLVLILLLAAAGYGVWYLLRWRRRQHAAEVTEAIQRARQETERRMADSRQPVAAAASTGGSGGTSSASGDASPVAGASGADASTPDAGVPDAVAPDGGGSPGTGTESGTADGSTAE